MEGEFESRFPLQNPFQYKDLRGEAVPVQGMLGEFFLTRPWRGYRMDGALLPRGSSGRGTRYYEPAASVHCEDDVGHPPEVDGGLMQCGSQA